jgi:4-carboxymuconolactone decarboxylase
MFAGNLLDAGSISARTRELVILRTCFRCGSEYEWGVHVALFSKSAGLNDVYVAATIAGDAARVDLPEPEVLLLRAVDELHETPTISDLLWAALALHYSSAQLIEMIALVGNYHAVSFIANAARVKLETFAPRMS